MVLEQIANLSLGVIRVLSSSLSRSAKIFNKEKYETVKDIQFKQADKTFYVYHS